MKRRWRSILIFVVAIVVIYVAIRQVLKFRLNEFLIAQEVHGIQITHDEINLEILNGSADVNYPKVQLTDDANIGFVGDMTLENLKINDIHYLDLLFNGTIDVESISLNKLQATFKTAQVDSTQIDNTGNRKNLGLSIKLKDLVLNECHLTIVDGQTDSLLLALKNFNLDVSNIEMSDRTIAHSIPFVGEDYKVSSDAIFVQTSPYEQLRITDLIGDSDYTSLTGLIYETVLSKADFDTRLTSEKDHYRIAVDSVQFQNLGLESIGEEDRISLSAQKISIIKPDIAIYRNKLLPDNQNQKPMYSKLLRDSPINVQIDSFQLKDALFTYMEKSKSNNDGGELGFKNMNVDITHLGNTYQENTEVYFQSLFMDSAPFEATWSFSVMDPKDTFTFKGELHGLALKELNKFTQPYADISLEGILNDVYFNIYGNGDSSMMDLKCKFNNVHVFLLQPDTHRKKKLLSALANILVSNNSKHRDDSYKEATVTVKRDKTKSSWNYIFKNIEEGMKKIMF